MTDPNTPGTIVGLVGVGIGGSRSPAIHQREADANGLRLSYRIVDLRGRADRLPAVVAAAADLGFAGLNVTHPFKQAVIPLLDRLSDEARALGAVNTVVFDADGATGYNTDMAGFRDSFIQKLPDADLSRVLQVGAGGAGAATAFAMLSLGAERLVLVDEDRGRAELLAKRLADAFEATRIDVGSSANAEVGAATGVINATPLGMEGYPGTAIDQGSMNPAAWVADIVYFPRETQLLREARAAGRRTVDGAGMVVLQAARAFELFTGVAPDSERMLRDF